MTTRCGRCGAGSPAGAVYCEACGAELGAVTGPACVACGAGAVDGDGYCGSCGHKQPGERDHKTMRDGVIAAVTDRGLRHHHNEDGMAIAALPGGGALLVVCDGVSSTPGSATASQAAADAAAELLRARLEAEPVSPIDEMLVDAVAVAQAAAAAVPAEPSSDPRHQGGAPSSTFVAAVARPGGGRITVDTAWVGDTRAYWVSEGEAVALTEDHEINGSLIRWLGADSVEPYPELSHLTSERPGRLVVCSDGLWRYADPPAALARLVGRLEAEHPTSEGLASALVEHALAGGGHDNITVAIWHSIDEPVGGTPDGADATGEPVAGEATSESVVADQTAVTVTEEAGHE